MADLIDRQAAIDAVSRGCKELRGIFAECEKNLNELPSAEPEKQNGIMFQEIVVRYPSYNTYPECKGKPYFSIKYTENGQEFVGYGTYKPEVLSEYLKEYFMPFAEVVRKMGRWIDTEPNIPDASYKKSGMAYYCSCCKHLAGKYKHKTYRFCPWCGAEMTEETE